ncbi:energy transducer TonB [Shimia biformata]|uniref:energy transducer TonB n=1 Tax=Shimia biformata TaxID=1294299 RepID=UPI00194FB8B1|nr:energy transducer TonB [Shimia biformata]
MHIGHYISGAAHAGLIGWALLAGVFASEPPEFEIASVSMISTEDFEAVLRAQETPRPETDVAMPVAPEINPEPPATTPEADPDVTRPTPVETETAEPDVKPDLSDISAPQPADVTDDAPQLPQPETDTAALKPRTAPDASPRPAPRVAPQPVAPPPPDSKIDDTLREASEPAEAPAEVKPVEEATAPEEATDQIVTEPKQTANAAPAASLRPKMRPTRPVEKPAETPTETAAAKPADSTPAKSDAVNAALAEAMAADTADTAAAPSGPPLTSAEKDGLRIAVQDCWVVDVGSQAANVTVTVGMSLDRNGRVQGDIRLIGATGGDSTAANTAFQAARRAILRCQKDGYKLPPEKYDSWRDVEITFNPEKMRSR